MYATLPGIFTDLASSPPFSHPTPRDYLLVTKGADFDEIYCSIDQSILNRSSFQLHFYSKLPQNINLYISPDFIPLHTLALHKLYINLFVSE